MARDSQTSRDFEDVVVRYMHEPFHVDPVMVRYTDPERALDLQRATVVELMGQTFRAWRDPPSACAGALVLAWQDMLPGAGSGLLDAAGAPKAPWHELRHLCSDRCVCDR